MAHPMSCSPSSRPYTAAFTFARPQGGDILNVGNTNSGSPRRLQTIQLPVVASGLSPQAMPTGPLSDPVILPPRRNRIVHWVTAPSLGRIPLTASSSQRERGWRTGVRQSV
jgi:hypothetical protein